MGEIVRDPGMRYRTIVADPPWAYPSPGGHLKSSQKHRPNSSAQNIGATSAGRYGSMTMPELKAMDVASIAEDDAHLYLWTTNKFVAEAFGLCEAWGFRPITLLTWGKVKADGTPSMKIGHYYRGATEHVVFGVRGSLGLSGTRAFPTLMLWPRTSGHSVKPDAFFELVEEASPGPYAELFARRERLGWSSWGDQVLSDMQIPTFRTAVVASGEGAERTAAESPEPSRTLWEDGCSCSVDVLNATGCICETATAERAL